MTPAQFTSTSTRPDRSIARAGRGPGRIRVCEVHREHLDALGLGLLAPHHVQFLREHIERDDRRTLGHERLDDRAADATRPTGDHHVLVLEAAHPSTSG